MIFYSKNSKFALLILNIVMKDFETNSTPIQLIPLDLIVESPWQGRLVSLFDLENSSGNITWQIDELKNSIEKSGLLHPVVLRKEAGRFQLIDGHRRVAAYKMLGKKNIEAIVKECTDKEAQSFSIIGNLQNRKLSPVEYAIAFKKILDNGLFKDQRELSKAIAKSDTYVADIIGVMKLDKRIIDDLITHQTINDIRMLRAIRRAGKVDENGKCNAQYTLYKRIIDEGLSRQTVLNLVTQKEFIQTIKVDYKLKPNAIELRIPRNNLSPEKAHLFYTWISDVIDTYLKDKKNE
ncbi:MAG: ParB/RepB/Spo0J family partition protein [Bacteroidales bacterium]|nr:ParB/RepB/Spo0J family partition protein [Bacteroidales bacterium]